MLLTTLATSLVLSASSISAVPLAVAPPLASPAQVAETWNDPTNAALLYWRYWSMVPKENEQKLAEYFSAETMDRPLPEEINKLVTTHAGEFAALVRATELASCDFGIEWSKGLGAMLPHLSKCRSTARWFALDCNRLMAEGKVDDAAQRVAAIYNLAGHVAQDRILISGLVSIAISSLGDKAAVTIAKSGRMTIPARDAMLAAAKKLRTAEFGMLPAIRSERTMGVNLFTTYDGPDGGARFIADYGTLFISEGAEKAAADPAWKKWKENTARMDGATLRAEAAKLAPFYDEAVSIWNDPDAVNKLKKLGDRLDLNEFGQFGRLMAPAFAKARQSLTKGNAALDQTITLLGQ